MTFVVALCSALGLALFFSGLPIVRRVHVRDRVEPYLSGLHGRPSDLLTPARSRGRGLPGIVTRVEELLPSGSRLEERLAAADGSLDVATFRLEQITWGIASLLGAWLALSAAAVAGAPVDARVVAPLSGLSFACGWLARDWWLGRRIEHRRDIVAEELPTAVDLMALSIVSGESVPAALARVARLLPGGVGSEFARTVADMRAGASTVEALEAMEQRQRVTGMERLVDALITGIERGAPLADVLRAQADDEREGRRRHLLETGGRREVLMLVPVVFLIMPVVVAFTLLPGVVALDLLVP